jgi:hypothetical protein
MVAEFPVLSVINNPTISNYARMAISRVAIGLIANSGFIMRIFQFIYYNFYLMHSKGENKETGAALAVVTTSAIFFFEYIHNWINTKKIRYYSK